MHDFSRLPQCVHSGISCSDWVYGVPGAEPPDHLCWNVAVGSIDYYLAAHFDETELDVSYSQGWPVSLGVRGLRRWYDQRRALVEANEKALVKSIENNTVWHWEPNLTTPPPAWFAVPVPNTADLGLALAARRDTPEGTLWLLGLAELIDETDAGRHTTWRIIGPVILSLPTGHRVPDARPLLRWYRRVLLGEKIRAGGPVPQFATQAECRTEIVKTYRGLLRSRPRPTLGQVAQCLGYTEAGLRKTLSRLGLKWKDLVAEARAK